MCVYMRFVYMYTTGFYDIYTFTINTHTMKILELITEQDKDTIPVKPGSIMRIAQHLHRRSKRDIVTGQPPEKLGTGYFGTVYSDPGDVTFAIKFSNLDEKDWKMDGYYAFLKLIDRAEDQKHNPYLPQIDSVERVQSVRGPYLKVRMEKLNSIETLGAEELELVFKKIFPKKEWPDEDFGYNIDWVDQLDVSMGHLFSGSSRSRDPALQTAVEMVRSLSHKYMVDMHQYNFMFRRTPHGAQLVITDPLSYARQ